MRRAIVLSFLAALSAAPVLALNPTSASAFGWCPGYAAPRGVVAPRARVYGYTAYRGYRPAYRSRVYRARYYRPGVRRRL